MDQSILSRRTEAAKDELTEVFGYDPRYDDIADILDDPSRRSKEDRRILNGYLKEFGIDTKNLKSAENYRNAFRVYREKCLWKRLLELRKSYSHPVKFMERTVDRLGDPAFSGDSLRMRILKQMLLYIDFSGTDIDIGEVLSPCSTGDRSVITGLDESVFDTVYGYKLKPAEDMTAMVRCFKDTARIEEIAAVRERLSGCLSEKIRAEYLSGETPMLCLIDRLLGEKLAFDEIFDTFLHSPEEIRQCFKDGIKEITAKYDFASKDLIDTFPKIPHSGQYYKSFNFIMKNYAFFREYNRTVTHCIDEAKLDADYRFFTGLPVTGKVYKCSDKDALVYYDCYLSFTGWYTDNYNKRKALNTPKRKYHERGGEWEKKEVAASKLIEYCNYLSSGGTCELDRVFAKKALYLFAFAFGMKYYPDKDGEYDPQLDIVKNLFCDFYNDNLIQFLENESGNGRYEREPSGVGINFKNYLECLYLYYLQKSDIPIRERYKRACGASKKILNAETKTDTPTLPKDENRTMTFRETHLAGLFECTSDAQLVGYILENYNFTRKNRSMSVYSIEDESRSAYLAFKEIMQKLTNSVEQNRLELVSFIEEDIKGALRQSCADCGEDDPLIHTAIDRISAAELIGINENNVTRTAIITAYFLYFCAEYRETCKPFGDVYDFFCYVDKYLERAGLQPISPKNVYDMILILFSYGITNFIQ